MAKGSSYSTAQVGFWGELTFAIRLSILAGRSTASEIKEHIEERAGFSFGKDEIWPLLHRLRDKGVVESTESHRFDGKQRRRVKLWSMTPEGKKDTMAAAERMRRLLD